jgi:5'-nucleotidase
MRSSLLYGAIAALAVSPAVQSLKILLGNDDGFGSANIREFYRLLKASGHDVILVAPVVDNSGQGGRSVFTNSPTLQGPGEYNLVAAGAPSLGTDLNDSHIWYCK